MQIDSADPADELPPLDDPRGGHRPGPSGVGVRAALAMAAAVLVGALGIARALVPDPSGSGTHRQLGLPPCAIAARAGRPCPTCGLTTAFAWSTRGRPDLAWRANPAGALLAPACLPAALWLAAGAWRGRPWGARSFGRPVVFLVLATAATCLLAWMTRLQPWRAL